MKKFIITLIIFSTIITIILILINNINWGKIGLSVLQRVTGYRITYEKIQGSIFKGYIIEDYVISISSTDSIYGKYAQISYRFSPLSFRLPSIFQLNLLEPTIIIKKKEGGTGGKFSPSIPNLSIRLNVKNGKFIYEDNKSYEINHISGLIFIDFTGKDIYLTTLNLSLESADYPIKVFSANIMLKIGHDRIETKSFKIKGKGLNLQGDAWYLIGKNVFSLTIKTGMIDLDELGVYQGKIYLQGGIHFANGRFLPQVQGYLQNIYLIDKVNFESNILGDTAIINLFNGMALNGSFSAQVKFVDLKNYVIETNFKNIDVAKLMGSKKSIIINGRLGLKGKRFFGILNSPKDNGIAIETLFVNGSLKGNHIYIDTLNIPEEDFNLSAQGILYPDFALNITLHRIDLKKFQRLYPIKGWLSGFINLQGQFRDLINTKFDGDMKISNFGFGKFFVKYSRIKVAHFIWKKDISLVEINLDSACYQNYFIHNINLDIKENKFSLKINRNNDVLLSRGIIDSSGTGKIDSLIFVFNQIYGFNIEPISFAFYDKKFGRIHLRIGDGEFYVDPGDRKLSFINLNLDALSKLFGLKEKIAGRLNLNIEKNLLSLNADSIFYRGMNNGNISIKGKYQDGKIDINLLSINDESGESLSAVGSFSLERSKFGLVFNNVRPWVFPFLYTFIDNPDGLISGKIDFEGNLTEFKITGRAEIKDARFGINAISAKFDSGYALVSFKENQIIFETIKSQTYSGSFNRPALRSWVYGGGIIKLEPNFRVRNLHFDFSFKDAPIQYQNYAYGIGTGNFSISMKDEIMYYNGNINIKEAIIPVEFGTYLESGPPEEQQEWRMNLKLSGERNIWLRNRDVDIEFGGEVNIVKEEGPLFVTGELETRRGNYYWFNHTLKITSGKVIFIPQEIIDPELDFWAELNTRERAPNTNQEIKIILHCTGNISEPVLEFFSEPPIYNEQDILTYLNLNISWQELESMKRGEYIGKILPQTILTWLESDVSRRLRAYTGLDYFRIEAPLFESEEKTRLTVGKYVSRKLFITYTYDITTYFNEFNVEYFIDDRNEILIKRDETGEYSLQYQYRIRF
uniref:Translocation and assembly module TamB C-terminal domain-containing protein n=1 Tax=candidate division WOR-3 bacterium TaxID=2052148 RepID=A0A7V3VUL7_UNCW3